MKFVFIPDIIKYEEEFAIEADSIEAAFEKLQEEFPYNCLLSMELVTNSSRLFLGIVEVSEDSSPRFVRKIFFDEQREESEVN